MIWDISFPYTLPIRVFVRYKDLLSCNHLSCLFFFLQELICHFSNRGKNIKESTKVHFFLAEPSIFICMPWPIGYPPAEKCSPSWDLTQESKQNFETALIYLGWQVVLKTSNYLELLIFLKEEKPHCKDPNFPVANLERTMKSKVRRICSMVMAASTVFLEVNPFMSEGNIHTPLSGVWYNFFEASCFILHNHAKCSLFLIISPTWFTQIMGAPCQSRSWIKDPESCPCWPYCLVYKLASVSGAWESFCSQKASPRKQS